VQKGEVKIMTNKKQELAEKPKNEVIYEVGNEEVKLTPDIVRQFVTKGDSQITQEEAFNFIQLAKFQKLNPFLNEIYLVKFGSRPAQMIVSKEAFMKRAEANKSFRGVKGGVIVVRGDEVKYLDGAFKLPEDRLVGGWAEVKRDDRDEPIRIEISMGEFNKNQSTWKSMPANMIRKTAIVNALREAFPNQLGALYTDEEIQDKTSDTKPSRKTVEATATDVESFINAPVEVVENEPKQETLAVKPVQRITPKPEKKPRRKSEPVAENLPEEPVESEEVEQDDVETYSQDLFEQNLQTNE